MGHRRRESGFTLIEIAIVVAIIGIFAAVAVPRFEQWIVDQRLKAAARTIADALSVARSEAIRTGDVQLVFFDLERPGVPLVDLAGNRVPVTVLDDGRRGTPTQNCRIDAGEPRQTFAAAPGVNWGATFAGVTRAPGDPDTSGAAIGSGISLKDVAGNAITWVAFQANGIPVSATAACVLGPTGSGAGAIYVTNGARDYAVVLAPLGGVRVHAWDRAAAGGARWRQ